MRSRKALVRSIHLWVGSVASATVLITALSAQQGSPPFGGLNHPTGKDGLFLVDKLGAHLRFFDPRTFQELSSIRVPANPHDFAVSPDHRFAYVPIYGAGVYGRNPEPGHVLYVVDLRQRAPAAVIDLAPYKAPHAAQVAPDGTVYVACDADRKLLAIDPVRRTVTAAIDTDGTSHWMAMLPNGSKMYLANKNDKPFVTVVDLKAQAIVARIEAPNGTQGIAASPDGSRVVAVDFREPQLLIIDPSKDVVIDRIPISGAKGAGYKAYFSPDGKWLATMGPGPQVNLIRAADLHGPQTVLGVGAGPMGFAFSPDGETMLVANHGEGTVSTVDLAAGRVTGTFKAGTGIETLTYF